MKEEAVPVFFPWKNNSLLPPRASVWERTKQPVADAEQDDMDVEVLLQFHDYDARSQPATIDAAQEIIEAQQLAIDKLRKRMKEVSVKQSFGLDRFLGSDEDIRFYTRYV